MRVYKMRNIRYKEGMAILSGDNANVTERKVETLSVRLVPEDDGAAVPVQSPKVVQRFGVCSGKETTENLKRMCDAAETQKMIDLREATAMRIFVCGDWMFHVRLLNHVAPNTPNRFCYLCDCKKCNIYGNPYASPSIDTDILSFVGRCVTVPMDRWVQDSMHLLKVCTTHMLEATYMHIYMYAPHVMDEFVGITSDFFTYGEEVDIAKCEAFLGLCNHPPSQSTKYRWGHLCDAISILFPRCKLVFDKRGPPAQATWCRHPYRLWWSSFVKNMYCAYERQPSDAQIEQFQTNNVRWHVLWIYMFSKPAHASHANVGDPSIIGKCFTPYCHSLVRHCDVFLRKYRTMYYFMQKCVEHAHKQTRKDFNSLRPAGTTKAAKHVLRVGELDRVLQRMGRLPV